ncbi:hypothetical protein DMN91_007822, partial [Ooceraea biroi]
MEDLFGEFWLGREHLWDHIETVDPDFWEDLGVAVLRMREAVYVSGSGIIREWTSVVDAVTQTDRRVGHASVQSEEAAPPATVHRRGVATQTEGRPISPNAGAARRAPTPVRSVPPIATGCWNCGGSHRYANCPRPREQFATGAEPGELHCVSVPVAAPITRERSPGRGPESRETVTSGLPRGGEADAESDPGAVDGRNPDNPISPCLVFSFTLRGGSVQVAAENAALDVAADDVTIHEDEG